MDTKDKRSFFKKGTKPDVYTILTNQCDAACTSSNLLVEFMTTLAPETAEKIEKTEKSADRKRENLIDYVENTFITPLDRHYLFKVSRVIDDLTDEIKDLKDFIIFFDFHPTEKNIEMAKISRDAIYDLTAAMKDWKTAIQISSGSTSCRRKNMRIRSKGFTGKTSRSWKTWNL